MKLMIAQRQLGVLLGVTCFSFPLEFMYVLIGINGLVSA
jgi:hypothetical protein